MGELEKQIDSTTTAFHDVINALDELKDLLEDLSYALDNADFDNGSSIADATADFVKETRDTCDRTLGIWQLVVQDILNPPAREDMQPDHKEY